MKNFYQNPPDKCCTANNENGFAHVFVVVVLAAVVMSLGLLGYKTLKERSLSSVEGISIAQADVKYLNLEGRFYDTDGTTPLTGVNNNGGLIRPEIVVTFDTGQTSTYKGAQTGTFTTRGLIVPAGARRFTLKSKVAQTKVALTDPMLNCDNASVDYAYYDCDAQKLGSSNRNSRIVNMDFKSTFYYHSPTAKITRLDKQGALVPGRTFDVEVEALAQPNTRLGQVKLQMLYTYGDAMYTCVQEATLPPAIDGDVLQLTNRGGKQTVQVTVPAFPTSTSHTYARPKYLAVYPVVSTKPLAYRGARYCSGKPVNEGAMCDRCPEGDVTNCMRKLELWKGCGTVYPTSTQGINSVDVPSSAKGAFVYIPIADGDTPQNPDLGKFELEVQRIGGGAAPKVRMTAKGQTVAWDVPVTSNADRTGIIGSVPNNTRLDDIKVFFVNADDNFEINGRGLRVFKLKLHGVTYTIDDPRVYSEGSDPVLCGHGFQRGNALYCKDSFFQFSSEYPRTVELMMQGTPSNNVYPMVRLVAGNKTWAQFSTNGTMRKYSALVPAWFTVPEIKVFYDNDSTNATGDRNLRVDYMKVNSQVYQTESPGVKSVGTWNTTTKSCVREPGAYMNSEWLYCNGWFQYQ